MTLSTVTLPDQYDGDAVTISFPVTFIFWGVDDLEVIHADSSGVPTTWVRGTQYTVSGGGGLTGTVVVSISPTDYTPAASETLTIHSILAYSQPLAIPAGGPLNTAALEKQFDQHSRQIQQIDERLGRALVFPRADDTALDAELATSTGRASARLGFDAAGEPIMVTADITTLAGTAFFATLADDVDAATARATLAAAGLGVANTFTEMQRWSQGADVASGGTLNLGTDGNFFDITGTTTINAIATEGIGTLVALQFDGALTLTHHATNLVLPGGQDIITVAGDIGVFHEYASADWRLVSWNPNIPIHLLKSVDPSKKIFFLDDFLGDFIKPELGTKKGSGAGTEFATRVSGVSGGEITLKSSTADGAHSANCSIITFKNLDWSADQGGLVMEVKLKIDDVSEAVLFVGFTDANYTTVELPIYKTLSADTLDSDAANACGICYDVDGTTDEWFHGGVKAGTDTGVNHSGTAPTDATYVTLRVEVSAAGAVEGFIDGTSIGAARTNAVTITTPITPAIVIGNRSANQVIAQIKYLWVQVDQ